MHTHINTVGDRFAIWSQDVVEVIENIISIEIWQ